MNVFSSLLIVYEGYEDPNEDLTVTEDSLPMGSPTTDVNSSLRSQGDCQSRAMEDDSHSGNCSYDADASNDSIELNLSLDEQPDTEQSSQNVTQTQSNHLPVCIFFPLSFVNIRAGEIFSINLINIYLVNRYNATN